MIATAIARRKAGASHHSSVRRSRAAIGSSPAGLAVCVSSDLGVLLSLIARRYSAVPQIQTLSDLAQLPDGDSRSS